MAVKRVARYRAAGTGPNASFLQSLGDVRPSSSMLLIPLGDAKEDCTLDVYEEALFF